MNLKDTNKYPSDLRMRKDFLGGKSEEEIQRKEKCLNLTRQKWKLILKNHSKQSKKANWEKYGIGLIFLRIQSLPHKKKYDKKHEQVFQKRS